MSYTALPTGKYDSDDVREADQERAERQPSKGRALSIENVRMAISLLLSMSLLVALSASKTLRSEQPVPAETCGNNSTEALSLGCSFHIMSFAWPPERCFDKELMEQFLAIRDWQWYLDPSGKNIADPSAVAAGSYDELFVTQEYHMYHCTYMWRKIHRATLAGKVLDGYIGDSHHTARCEMQILNAGRNLSDISTTIYTKFVSCSRMQRSRERWGWYRILNGHRAHKNPQSVKGRCGGVIGVLAACGRRSESDGCMTLFWVRL